jgi:hypothetical protein
VEILLNKWVEEKENQKRQVVHINI